MTRPKARLLLLATIAFVVLGLADGSLGVAWPSIAGRFDRRITELGSLLLLGGIGYLTSSIGYGWIHDRIGTGIALRWAGLTTGVALLGISAAPSWPVVIVSVISFGLGAGVIDSGLNAHAALEFDVRSTNLLHGAYGIGATLGPIVITASIASGSAWRGGYVLVALAQVAVFAALWRTGSAWTAVEHPDDAGGCRDTQPLRPTVAVMLLTFLIYTGAEVAAGQWSFTLLTESRGMGPTQAGIWVAAYWGGLTAGRLIFGFIGDSLAPSLLLQGSIAVATSGLALLWADPGGVGYVGLPMAGLGFAAVFPTLISITPSLIGRRDSTRMVGYQLAAANIGAASVPWTIGFVAANFGVSSLAPSFLGAALLLSVLVLATTRRTPDTGQAATRSTDIR